MTAPTRLKAVRSLEVLSAHWHAALPIRQEWLAWGLCTEPADRTTAERCLSRIYAGLGRGRPRFEWVDSPRRALDRLAGLPDHEELRRWVTGRTPPGRPPLASDLAAGLSRLRSALDDGLTHDDLGSASTLARDKKPWPVLPAVDALKLGVPLREVLRQGVRLALENSLATGFYLPVRAVLGSPATLPVGWYGQQDASWIAYYDVMRRLKLGHYPSADDTRLNDWADLARSCGWWWPGEDRVVLVERPAVIRTMPALAVEYRDGWQPFTT
jgi:hypothetical protein